MTTPETLARQLWELGTDNDEAAYVAQATRLLETFAKQVRDDENAIVGRHLKETVRSLQERIAHYEKLITPGIHIHTTTP